MNETLHFIARHGYLVLAGSVLGRQACLPIPANLFLIAAGALAHDGKLNFSLAVAVSVMTFLFADLGWYDAGRRFGQRILHFVCGLSSDPESCVQRAVDTFARHGVNTLLVSKFVIGLDAVAVPMAGSAGVRPMHFILFEVPGALFWSVSYASLGYIFHNQLDRVAVHLARMSIVSAIALGLIGCYYIARKLTRWFRFLHLFKLARITPDELRNKLSRGEDILIVDLQGRQRWKSQPMAIPGAVRINPHHLEQYEHVQIPLSQEVVLYCACPGEFISARVALALKRRGIEQVRPLAGGLEAWRDRGFPLTSEVQTASSSLHQPNS